MAKPPAAHFDGLEPPALHFLRGQYVVLDRDVARYFGVATKAFNQQVKRNRVKLGDFIFELTAEEWARLKSQAATSTGDHGGDRYVPRAFTDHGVVMAATILRSERAVAASRFIVKTFVEARRREAGASPPALVGPGGRPTLARRINAVLAQLGAALTDAKLIGSLLKEGTTLANEGVSSVKEHLKRPLAQNERDLAEARKLTAEAEAIEIETSLKRTTARAKQLELLERKLRLVSAAQGMLGIEGAQDFIKLLEDFRDSEEG